MRWSSSSGFIYFYWSLCFSHSTCCEYRLWRTWHDEWGRATAGGRHEGVRRSGEEARVMRRRREPLPDGIGGHLDGSPSSSAVIGYAKFFWSGANPRARTRGSGYWCARSCMWHARWWRCCLGAGGTGQRTQAQQLFVSAVLFDLKLCYFNYYYY